MSVTRRFRIAAGFLPRTTVAVTPWMGNEIRRRAPALPGPVNASSGRVLFARAALDMRLFTWLVARLWIKPQHVAGKRVIGGAVPAMAVLASMDD